MADRLSRPSTKRMTKPRTNRRRSLRKLDAGTDAQTSYFFMLNCLLHSRVHTGIESNSEFYDEDVNVYLAQLLNAHIDPKHLARMSEHVALTDVDLFNSLGPDGDYRRRYVVYKANADFLLMASSIFELFDEPRHNCHPALRTPKEVYVGRAATYYALAASYAAKLAHGETSIAATLRKLSRGIDNYVRILSYMRGQYLDFIKRYSSGELFHLDRAIEEIQRDETIEHMRNEFLDTYHAWLKTGADELKTKLTEQARLLKEIDPTFEFTPPL